MKKAASHCVIRCRPSGLTVQWQPGSPPILDLLEQAGGQPAYSCRYGNCHSCVATLLTGEVAHPPEVTAPAAGQLLTCCAAPLSAALEIEFD